MQRADQPAMTRRLLALVLAVWIVIQPTLTYAAPALDGHAKGSACGATNPTAALTTSGAGIVVALAGNENASISTLAPTMTPSGAGLSWVKFSDQNKISDGITSVCPTTGCNLNSYMYSSVWYAVSAGAIAAQTITATLSGSTDASGLIVFGVSGSDTSTVVDPAQPCAAIEDPNDTGNVVFLPGVYTNATNPFQLVESVAGNLDSVSAAPAGFTDIEYVQNASCTTHYYYDRASYQVYGAALSNVTLTWTGSPGSAGHLVKSTAICGATGGCNGSVRSTCPNHPANVSGVGTLQFQTPISYRGDKPKVIH